jgi:hypothetical protein
MAVAVLGCQEEDEVSDLDEKLKEIRVDHHTVGTGSVCLIKHPHSGPCAGGSSEVGDSIVEVSLDDEAIRQVKQAFIDAGWLDPTKVESVVMRNVGTVSEKYACRAEDCYLKGDHYHTWSGKVYDA